MTENDLFTQPAQPKATVKFSIADYILELNKVISELFYCGGEIIDTK